MRRIVGEPRGKTKKVNFHEFLGGVRFIQKHEMLRWVALLFALFALLSEATIDLTIFRLENELFESKRAIGMAFGVASLGAVIAGLSASALRRRWGFGACFLGSLILQGIAVVGLGLLPRFWMLVVMATTFMLGLMVKNINTMSLRQQVTPEHLLGRVSAAFWTIIALMGPIGALFATALAEVYGTSTVLVGMGLLGIVVAAAGFCTPAQASEAPKSISTV